MQGNEQNDIDIFNKLADELVVHILSRMSLKEAMRTGVLARRWRYLWRSVFGTLQFNFRYVLNGAGGETQMRNFVSWVNNVMELHQGRYVEGMVVIFEGMIAKHRRMIREKTSGVMDSWVCFAVRKEVERLELRVSNDGYVFPSIEMLRSHCSSPFRRLRSLRLGDISIEDEVVHHLLGLCPDLEDLCICGSGATKELRVVDPPRLRFLEIKECYNLEILEVSCESLVSLAYVAKRKGDLRKVPNLRELTIGNESYIHFISDPNTSSYSDQLVKLVVDLKIPMSLIRLARLPDWLPQFMSLRRLELRVVSLVGRSILFFTWMIKAAPQLCEFRIEMSYCLIDMNEYAKWMAFPAMSRDESMKCDHRNLKVVEMYGYDGLPSEEEFLLELLKNASLIEMVFIETKRRYYDDPAFESYYMFLGGLPLSGMDVELIATSRAISRARAKRLVSTLPHHIKYIIT